MDWLSLLDEMPADPDLSPRTRRLLALGAVIDGTMYDHIREPFTNETNGAGQYVPLDKRRPSVRTNLCRTVVDDSVSLLFSETHFPQVHARDKATSQALARLIAESRLNEAMVVAARRGSIGSAAILMQVLDRRVCWKYMPTAYLEPVFDPVQPHRVLSVKRHVKVDAKSLAARGYAVDEDDGAHWLDTVWTTTDEQWFLPYPVVDHRLEAITPTLDRERTISHQLGFCPVVWIRNMPSDLDDIDGCSTFEAAIDTVIELDYLLSQNGRGLKYSADPTLWIKEPSVDPSGQPINVGGAAAAIVTGGEKSEAKLLEISGNAAHAVDAHAEKLRSMALEQMHGNRTNPDKLSAATSGRAMELLNQGLVWLADRLRITYGEGALLDLMRMVCAASKAIEGGIIIDGEAYTDLDPTGLNLKWAPWFVPTSNDLVELANAVKALLDTHALSRESAVKMIATVVGVDDVQAELAMIAADEAAQIALIPPTAVNVTEAV